ncbi:MAG: hypothetical protein WBV61_06385 [Rhodanobacteraceae bacterium]
MSADVTTLIELVLGVIGLFAVTIIASLKIGARAQADTLQETNADWVWNTVAGGDWNRTDLLYGIWERNMTDVVMVVRDHDDSHVGTITDNMFAATITIGDETFRASPGATWHETAELVAPDASASSEIRALCTFERTGWFGHRVARYALPGSESLTIRVPWAFPGKPSTLRIEGGDGSAIGQLCSLGGWAFNKGRALTLPSSVPLPVRLFVLWKGAGARSRNRST